MKKIPISGSESGRFEKASITLEDKYMQEAKSTLEKCSLDTRELEFIVAKFLKDDDRDKVVIVNDGKNCRVVYNPKGIEVEIINVGQRFVPPDIVHQEWHSKEETKSYLEDFRP
jgi:hypothetical protein